MATDTHPGTATPTSTRTKIKLVLTDLDGTAVGHGHAVAPASSVEAVRRAYSAGAVVTAVTGRKFEDALPTAKALGIREIFCADGGASIWRPGDRVMMWHAGLDEDVAVEASAILGHFGGDTLRVSSAEYARPSFSAAQREKTPVTLSVFARVPGPHSVQVLTLLRKLPDVVAHITSHRLDTDLVGIQVTRDTADKAHGATRLLSYFHFEPSQVLAIGNGDNDLGLFSCAGTKIAVANASDALKAAADLVVGSWDEDGLLEAVERFVA